MRYCKNQYKFFLNPLDPNTTNIAKDIFTIPTEDKKLKKNTQKRTPGCEKVLILQKPVGILKKQNKQY